MAMFKQYWIQSANSEKYFWFSSTDISQKTQIFLSVLQMRNGGIGVE